MTTLKEACDKILRNYGSEFVITNITDIGYGWVFSVAEKNTGIPLIEPPSIIHKSTGALDSFFLPDKKHFAELEHGTVVPIP